jgi:hypothetical protein
VRTRELLRFSTGFVFTFCFISDVIQSANSSATAQRGGTVVTCGIKLEVGAPTAQAPTDGRFGADALLSVSFSHHYFNIHFFELSGQCKYVSVGIRLAGGRQTVQGISGTG